MFIIIYSHPKMETVENINSYPLGYQH